MARAKPIHSMISPRKLAPETYVNKPPVCTRVKSQSSELGHGDIKTPLLVPKHIRVNIYTYVYDKCGLDTVFPVITVWWNPPRDKGKQSHSSPLSTGYPGTMRNGSNFPMGSIRISKLCSV